jgi:hypothetical protein
MNRKLKLYIKQNMENEKRSFSFSSKARAFFYEDNEMCEVGSSSSINNYINENKNENMFQSLLFKYIDERNLKDSDVYNKVHLDRRLFSKIRSDINYHPSKETVILLGLSLELSEDEIENLLESASYSLPKNNYYDLIIRFCFKEKIYDLKTINDFLDEYDQKMFSY